MTLALSLEGRVRVHQTEKMVGRAPGKVAKQEGAVLELLGPTSLHTWHRVWVVGEGQAGCLWDGALSRNSSPGDWAQLDQNLHDSASL